MILGGRGQTFILMEEFLASALSSMGLKSTVLESTESADSEIKTGQTLERGVCSGILSSFQISKNRKCTLPPVGIYRAK